MFRCSSSHESQPLLADSPTHFCQRPNCTSCMSGGTNCFTSNASYSNVLLTSNWSVYAHEQVMTMVTLPCSLLCCPVLEKSSQSYRRSRFSFVLSQAGHIEINVFMPLSLSTIIHSLVWSRNARSINHRSTELVQVRLNTELKFNAQNPRIQSLRPRFHAGLLLLATTFPGVFAVGQGSAKFGL